MSSNHPVMDTESVRHAYRRWAPVYDYTFGQVAEAGRKHAVKIINQRKGRVLEVGVGTGLSLPAYGKHLTVTGIDLSPEMLDKAREKVTKKTSAMWTGSTRWTPAPSASPTRASTRWSPCM
ncbi:MAG: hypothetical protein A49_03070 [Methyloceanibacter sp.]|nr:MAG: hypothetical protein A49_03070 [Methyloceanibacter sp.]